MFLLLLLLLLLSSLTSCLCGLELNVAHTSYQAEEEQNVTLDWTFTPKPDPSLKSLSMTCDFYTDEKVLVLFELVGGVVHSKSLSEEFSGRVQFDKDLLREGRIRLHVSSLRTQDSGWYICHVATEAGRASRRSHLRVTAARTQGESEIEPEALEAEVLVWKDVVAKGGMVAGLLALMIAFCLLIFSSLKEGCVHSPV